MQASFLKVDVIRDLMLSQNRSMPLCLFWDLAVSFIGLPVRNQEPNVFITVTLQEA